MYLSIRCIRTAMANLRAVHPFFGITFLSCKANNLPVGEEEQDYQMDQKTKQFMDEHHRLDPDSKYYYQPYKSNSKETYWVRHDYASSGLQAINTQTFISAFLHSSSKTWGWKKDYVARLETLLKRNKKGSKLPLLTLAIWIFRNKEWEGRPSPGDIIQHFLVTFKISDEERTSLFDDDSNQYSLADERSFQEQTASWEDLAKENVSAPPDAEPVKGATLSYLELNNVGPSENLSLEPNSRLNIITGDNGLGKSFIMECAWWAFTGNWAEAPASKHDIDNESLISYAFAIDRANRAPKETVKLDKGTWERKDTKSLPGLIIYARVDGSYAVWEPIKRECYFFSRMEVWDGLAKKTEGLIRDWVTWQNTPEESPFEKLMQVLKKVSPPDMGELQAGVPLRTVEDPRRIPTIIHPYGSVPMTHVSAGIRRIVTLAYLIVWAWHEHIVRANDVETTPERRMVILVDELEVHLHPKWQRTILPALVGVPSLLDDELDVQFIVSTHSPLVLASAEPLFRDDTDKLFQLYTNEKNGCAELDEVNFMKYGRVDSWLTSPIFNLQQARSREAEDAINLAKALQLEKDPRQEDVLKAHQSLVCALSETDPFWPRWLYFAESKGVKI